MRSWLARTSLIVNALTFGPPNTYLCARVAARWGAYSLPCRLLDMLCREPGHCRKQLWFDRFQKP